MPVFMTELGIDDMKNPPAELEPVFDEMEQHSILLFGQVKKGTDMML
jgi:hypothetical protein